MWAQTIVCVRFGEPCVPKRYAYNGLGTQTTKTLTKPCKHPKNLSAKGKNLPKLAKTPKTSKTSPAPKTSAEVFGAGEVFGFFWVFAGFERFLPFAERFLGFLQGFVMVLVVWVPKPLYA